MPYDPRTDVRVLPNGSHAKPKRGAKFIQSRSTTRVGDVILVECTDPLSAIDIPNLLNQTGDILESTERRGEVLRFRIRKA